MSRSKSQRSSNPPNPLANKDDLAALWKWFLPDGQIFSKLKRHGNTSWLPVDLVWLALCWAWSEARHVTDAFTQAVGYQKEMSGASALSTYQGFMGALTRWTPPFLELLWPVLHARMKEVGGRRFWRVGKWVPIAFDGSRSTAPRSKANEQAFCAKNYGQGQTAKYRKKKSQGLRRQKNKQEKPQPQEPQAWITLLWHMGLRLPWMWRLGPSNSSERGHVMEMVCALVSPSGTLFCGDAGFVGSPLWSAILKQGADFLVRVGANVNLLTLEVDWTMAPDGLVLCWPKGMQDSGAPPLRLRLVKAQIGNTTVWLLTSILDPQLLTDEQMVRLYKMRWGIEIEFRGLKQTLDRAKLRCLNDKRLLAELHWSLMAMAVAELFALKEQLHKRPGSQCRPDPVKRSLANTMRALRQCLRNLSKVPEPGQCLEELLQGATTDNYQRKASKRSRYRRKNPDKKPLGDPKLRQVTTAEKKLLEKMAV
jgi:hypothetical protein